jgi:hypothetical protein
MDEGLYDFEDIFRFPWELSEELDLLRKRWRDLYNQVKGRGISPRTDIDPSIQQKIIKDFSEFSYWENNLGFGQRLTSSYNDELERYKAILIVDIKTLVDWLKANNSKEAPPVSGDSTDSANDWLVSQNLNTVSPMYKLLWGGVVVTGLFVVYKLLREIKS